MIFCGDRQLSHEQEVPGLLLQPKKTFFQENIVKGQHTQKKISNWWKTTLALAGQPWL